MELHVAAEAAPDVWRTVLGAGVTPAGLGRARHAAPRGRAAAARSRARTRHHAAAGRARLGRPVGQRGLSRARRPRRRARARRRPTPARASRRRAPDPARRLRRRDRRRDGGGGDERELLTRARTRHRARVPPARHRRGDRGVHRRPGPRRRRDRSFRPRSSASTEAGRKAGPPATRGYAGRRQAVDPGRESPREPHGAPKEQPLPGNSQATEPPGEAPLESRRVRRVELAQRPASPTGKAGRSDGPPHGSPCGNGESLRSRDRGGVRATDHRFGARPRTVRARTRGIRCMSTTKLGELERHDRFVSRHIGPDAETSGPCSRSSASRRSTSSSTGPSPRSSATANRSRCRAPSTRRRRWPGSVRSPRRTRCSRRSSGWATRRRSPRR